VESLSYTSLTTYLSCGYRFYAERVLGLPAAPDQGAEAAARAGTLSAAERGSAVHALLERLDFRRPLRPSPKAIAAVAARAPTGREATEIAALVERFGASELCRRIGRATRVRREQPFAFALGQTMITGALDVIAAEPGDSVLVVDYKTDRLEGAQPAAVVDRAYRTQRLVYALAALRSGAGRVEVVHVFLEAPDHPVAAAFDAAQLSALEQELETLAEGVLSGEFAVTETPRREVCRGCPAEGGLCSWPLDMTRREAADRLF
jgi:RecB family exonuclease